MSSDDRFQHNSYLVREKILKLLGGAFHVYDPSGNVVMYAKQKAFKLKEDIRLYESEAMQTEILRIHARNIIDFSATYDVIDASTEEVIGSLRRSGLKSILKDEWVVMNGQGEEIGKIHEDSQLMALLRRFLTNLIPQTYHVYNNSGDAIVEMKRNFNPFVNKINVDFMYGAEEVMDKRLGLAATILLTAIEGKQN